MAIPHCCQFSQVFYHGTCRNVVSLPLQGFKQVHFRHRKKHINRQRHFKQFSHKKDPIKIYQTWFQIHIHISGFHTLWLFNIAMENGPFIDDFPIHTSIYKGFSTAMLNNRSVSNVKHISRFHIKIRQGFGPRLPAGRQNIDAVSHATGSRAPGRSIHGNLGTILAVRRGFFVKPPKNDPKPG